MQTNNSSKSIDFVLGGGGPKGDGHAGFLKAAEEMGINLGTGTGVSIGSVALTLYKNSYSPKQIHEILCDEFERLKDHSELNKHCLRWPSPAEFLKGELLDLLPVFRRLVAEYKLEAKPDMQIVAYDVIHKRPKIYANCNYDLAEALTASCALPGLMKPITHCANEKVGSWADLWHTIERLRKQAKSGAADKSHGIYFDGWLHHPYAFDFSTKPVLISKLGTATRITSRRWQQLSFPDRAFHLFELSFGSFSHKDVADPKPEEGLLIQTGIDSVASVAWDLPRSVHREMFDYGYAITRKRLQEARQNGFLYDAFLDH